ncbi:MAG: hypothetical protein ABSE87_10690 [Terracidiphilus sp.]|jgi:hypothetical protein
MSDALKFAFEILVVGALALPWLTVLNRMFPTRPGSGLHFDLSAVPKPAQTAVSAAVVLAFGYLLGSVVSRISRDIFNDELFGNLPTEDRIREAVYKNEYCTEHLVRNLSLPFKPDPALAHKFGFCPGTVQMDTPERFEERVTDLFRLQESALLLQGQDKVDRLKQYFDQINILRGAALNGLILFALCAFGSLGTLRARWIAHPILKALTFVPAAAVAAYGLYSLILNHYVHPSRSIYADPPLAETVLLLLGMGGLVVVSKAKEAAAYFRTCVVAGILTVVSFGAWWWTEVMYDIQVIHSQPRLAGEAPASAPANPN